MRRLAIAIALLTAGCASRPENFEVSGFGDDAKDELAELQSAATEWCERTNGDYCPTLAGGENSVQLVEALSGGASQRYELTDSGIGHIWIADRSDKPGWLRYLRRSFLHELGHNAGCRKDGPAGTVMAANENESADHLTAYDVQCAYR